MVIGSERSWGRNDPCKSSRICLRERITERSLVSARAHRTARWYVPVSLVVAGLPEFDISQSSVAFTALQAQSQPVSTTISLTTGQNPAVDYELDVTASTWLTVTPTSGITPMAVTVTADPTGLRVGSYSGSIIVSSSGKRLQTIPVNLTIANAPTLTTSPPFLVYTYSHGGSSSVSREPLSSEDLGRTFP